jgi:mRNA-degrading endonuclease toxin of MazEF toxin-antitoxin module
MKTREPVEFRRGDILWTQCDPSVGVLPRKTRTCVVASNDVAHRYEPAVTVVPTQASTADRAACERRVPRSRRPASRTPPW